MTGSIQLQTERLILVASTETIARAEARDREELARLLGAVIHPAWPPGENDQAGRDFLHRRLREHPEAVGFLGWSWLVRPQQPEEKPLLIGGGGFKGPPGEDGTIEIGYSIVEEHYGRGLATEAVAATLAWAFAQPRVRRVIAETLPDLIGSQRVLEKNGFERSDEPATDSGSIRFVLSRERWIARARPSAGTDQGRPSASAGPERPAQ